MIITPNTHPHHHGYNSNLYFDQSTDSLPNQLLPPNNQPKLYPPSINQLPTDTINILIHQTSLIPTLKPLNILTLSTTTHSFPLELKLNQPPVINFDCWNLPLQGRMELYDPSQQLSSHQSPQRRSVLLS